MNQNPEEIIKKVYQLWKNQLSLSAGEHPSEEEFVGFFNHELDDQQENRFKAHLVRCQRCAQISELNDLISRDLKEEVPLNLIEKAKGLVKEDEAGHILAIILKLKPASIDLIRTCGDVLLGQELVPSAVLRSRKISEFKNQITILKDFENLRVEIKTENINGKSFNLEAVTKNKKTFDPIDDLRITLLKGEIEMESYLSLKGKVVFENLSCGAYQLKISDLDSLLALISLEIKN